MIALVSLAWAGPFDAVEAESSPAAKVEALLALTADENPEVAAEAWARTATTLQAQGYVGSATLAWAEALVAESEQDHFAQAMGPADTFGDPAAIAEAVTQMPAFDPADDAGSRAAYLVARHQLRSDRLGPSIDWLKRVDPQSPVFADSESLRGVVLANQGLHDDALVPLQTARALGKAQDRGRRYDDKLLINLARVYYAGDNVGQSIYHYTLMPRDSEFWPEARFEKAWAHFKADDMQGTLGELQTHTGPFFEDVWLPDAFLLKAQGEYLLCKFATALETMNAFEARYEPAIATLDAKLGTLDAAGAFAMAAAVADGGKSPLPKGMLRHYRDEDRLEEARRAVSAYREEAGRVSGFGSVGSQLAKRLEARASLIETSEGERILARLQSERDEVEQSLTGLELTRVDILQLESRLYEKAAATGTLEHGDKIGKLRDLRKNKRGFHVWPFQGEYWADEVGWFQVDARSDCPSSMSSRGTGAK